MTMCWSVLTSYTCGDGSVDVKGIGKSNVKVLKSMAFKVLKEILKAVFC